MPGNGDVTVQYSGEIVRNNPGLLDMIGLSGKNKVTMTLLGKYLDFEGSVQHNISEKWAVRPVFRYSGGGWALPFHRRLFPGHAY